MSTREVRASEAQVEAAKVAIGAGFTRWLRNVFSVTEDPSHRKTALQVVDCVDVPARTREARAVADAVVAAGPDADEVTRLRADVEHWKHHAWEAGEGFKRAIEDAVKAGRRRRAAEAELERLAEVVARVEALAKAQAIHCRVKWRTDEERTWLDVLAIIESAALSGPSPARTPTS